MSHTPPLSPLLIALQHLQRHGPNDPTTGICSNVKEIIGFECYAQLNALIARWPDKAYNNLYPVEGSMSAYAQAGSNKWQDSRRLALLYWLTTELQKQRLLDILLHLAKHGPRDPGQGICLNAGRLAKAQTADGGSRTMQGILSKLIARWPDNRDNAYPVEGSALAYFQAGSNKWQDPRRLALLNWLIEELQKDVRTTTQDAKS